VADDFAAAARTLVDTAAGFYRRGWMLGTSGNLSIVISRDPLRLAITRSGVDKGALTSDQVLEVNAAGERVRGEGKASDETSLHLEIVRKCSAGSVLHTHSVWGTILSDAHAGAGGFALEGYEMLKGLAGVRTHEHREWVPVLPNTQDYTVLVRDLGATLDQYPQAHGVLLAGHGLYTWGMEATEARRHVEILEFLLEVRGRLFLAGRG
jgi:methylthioribulose-1-phosphate dehydratase